MAARTWPSTQIASMHPAAARGGAPVRRSGAPRRAAGAAPPPPPPPPPAAVLERLRAADAVCFDVDSTVCTDEGIDELAAACGAGEAVAKLTAQAMGGTADFREALSARLGLINPTRAQLEGYLSEHAPALSPGIAEVVSALQARGAEVFLVSGGFTQMIGPVADALKVPRDNIFANTILFDEAGEYAGFDEEAFTSRSGGKAKAVAHIRAVREYSRVVMVGDGATDLEARAEGGAEVFIGYGGVQVRDVVKEGADWFIYGFDPFIDALRD